MSAIGETGRNARRPANLRERAYHSFTRHLLARDIKAGQFISQRELVELTGLPLGAIRELVPRLEAEGLVRTAPQRGMQIAHVDLNLVRDAFQYRLFLEKEAVAVFAQNVRQADLDRLRDVHAAILARCEEAARQGGVGADLVAEAQLVDWDLHATIIDSLGNAIISEAYRVNAIKIRLIRQQQTQLNDEVVIPTMREHLGIIDAIATRDPAKASATLGEHIIGARNRAMDMR
ncbi:transcriptional regulator, GntR family [Rhizobiales bacterium GAS191]|jgi:DNA-binding GntR family transcriptional regulator|nr:transcriptional regulator, GntR family [Rhizobiales bacterium GAS113]SEC39376.1 transcriptional regulator, GntR family [Rhizobiales bacterium GAS191]SEC86534.1 transcriptional regulator, GntR family [Rhizobiales bacterium GAS188]